MLEELLFLIIPGMMWVFFFYEATDEGGIFEPLRWALDWVEMKSVKIAESDCSDLVKKIALGVQNFMRWVSKPIDKCLVCMGSLHGLFIYAFSGVVGLHSLPFILIFIYPPLLSGSISISINLIKE